MNMVTIEEAQAKLPELIANLAPGEEIVITQNDQPVAGILVRFAIRGGRGASFSGQRVLSVTTDAAGRAAASGLTPVTTGSMEITASASYQGQTATVAISQTNFATAQQAADAAKAGGGSSGATGATAGVAAGKAAGAGAGGGLSGTTIGIIGAVAGGGILVAAKAAGGGSGSSAAVNGGGAAGGGGTGGGTAGGGGGTAQSITVTGPFSLQTPISWTYVQSLGSCTMVQNTTGTVRMVLQTQTSGAVTGTAEMTGSGSNSGLACTVLGGGLLPGTASSSGTPGTITGPVSGTTASLVFTQAMSQGDGNATFEFARTFVGSLTNGIVTGTLRETQTWSYPAVITSGGGTASTQVTLR